MLAIFNKEIVNIPEELHSPPVSSFSSSSTHNPNPKFPHHILSHFLSSTSNPFSITFGPPHASLSFAPSQNPKRLFCGYDEIYCIFFGSLNNLSNLIKQYGLSSRSTNEAMLVIEAYRTLRDRGPYPAHQVLKDLDGSFGFVVYDSKDGAVFAALGADEGVELYWGVAADGSLVISDELEVVKASCAKSFAPFPAGCMYHSEGGLMSYEHPRGRMMAMPRIDSEGAMCGAHFQVDLHSPAPTMPRVGSEANWALRGPRA